MIVLCDEITVRENDFASLKGWLDTGTAPFLVAQMVKNLFAIQVSYLISTSPLY